MPRRNNKHIRVVNNRGQHQRVRTTRGHRIMSKFKKYKYYNEGGDTMQCPVCGGTIVGDGYTIARHCENVDLPLDVEPDVDVIYCKEEGGEVK